MKARTDSASSLRRRPRDYSVDVAREAGDLAVRLLPIRKDDLSHGSLVAVAGFDPYRDDLAERQVARELLGARPERTVSTFDSGQSIPKPNAL